MKHLAIIFFLLASCGMQSDRKKIETKETVTSNYEISVIEIDSCEYILFDGYRNGGIIHKQNCIFCEKRKGN